MKLSLKRYEFYSKCPSAAKHLRERDAHRSIALRTVFRRYFSRRFDTTLQMFDRIESSGTCRDWERNNFGIVSVSFRSGKISVSFPFRTLYKPYFCHNLVSVGTFFLFPSSSFCKPMYYLCTGKLVGRCTTYQFVERAHRSILHRNYDVRSLGQALYVTYDIVPKARNKKVKKPESRVHAYNTRIYGKLCMLVVFGGVCLSTRRIMVDTNYS